jgi:hypothetical protein
MPPDMTPQPGIVSDYSGATPNRQDGLDKMPSTGKSSLPGADFGASHHDFLKHPEGEAGHDVPLPGSGFGTLHDFNKHSVDQPGKDHHNQTHPPSGDTHHVGPGMGSPASQLPHSQPIQPGPTQVYPAGSSPPITAEQFRINPRDVSASDASTTSDHPFHSGAQHDAGVPDSGTSRGFEHPGSTHSGSAPINTQGERAPVLGPTPSSQKPSPENFQHNASTSQPNNGVGDGGTTAITSDGFGYNGPAPGGSLKPSPGSDFSGPHSVDTSGYSNQSDSGGPHYNSAADMLSGPDTGHAASGASFDAPLDAAPPPGL